MLRSIPCSASLTLHPFLPRSLSFPLCLYPLSDSPFLCWSLFVFKPLSLYVSLHLYLCFFVDSILLPLFFSSLCLSLFLLISLSIFLLLLQIFSLMFGIFFWDSLESCAFIRFYYYFFNHYSMNWVLGLALWKVTNIAFILVSVQGYSHCPSIEKTKIKKLYRVQIT